MTWEQELKIQSKEIAAKIAPIMAKNMAEGMAKDIARGMAKDLAKDMAQNMVKKARAEERTEALKEGQQKKAIDTARNLLGMNLTAEQIAQATGLPLEQILALQKELSAPTTD